MVTMTGERLLEGGPRQRRDAERTHEALVAAGDGDAR